jgi:TetR/AcrR family transcriptional repressor of bet genes
MPRIKKKSAPPKVARARPGHTRQHQLLIDACISALHLYGPSNTTVEKVVAIAKMSPGIVRFYFASKAQMLVASLQFLAAEFEQQLMLPVARLKSSPVAALELLVDLYLDPEIASPRKVSVWYAFWGEASSRQEYYDICGQKDESFTALVRELVERLISQTGQSHLDADAVALGLIGVLEVLWQDFAFRSEAEIDRAGARRRAKAYLKSVFPACFPAEAPAGSAGSTLSASRYDSPQLFALERERILQTAWQFVAHESQLVSPGDYVAADLGFARVLVIRDEDGALRAFRNACSEAPHALLAPGAGRLEHIGCPIHGVSFDLRGNRIFARGSLPSLELDTRGPLVLTRAASPSAAVFEGWQDLRVPAGCRHLGFTDTLVAADWKLLVEQWLEVQGEAKPGWSTRAFATVSGHPLDRGAQLRFLGPNQWFDARCDGFTVQQILPLAAGQCVLRQQHFSLCESAEVARALRFLAARITASARPALAMVESIQSGLVTLGYPSRAPAAQVAAFQRALHQQIPQR